MLKFIQDGAGEIAQWIKGFLCRHEKGSSRVQNTCKNRAPCNPSTQGRGRAPLGKLLARPEVSELWVLLRPFLYKLGGEIPLKTPNVNLKPPRVHINTYMHVCILYTYTHQKEK